MARPALCIKVSKKDREELQKLVRCLALIWRLLDEERRFFLNPNDLTFQRYTRNWKPGSEVLCCVNKRKESPRAAAPVGVANIVGFSCRPRRSRLLRVGCLIRQGE